MTDAVEQQAAFSRECALIAAKAADEKKATDIMVQEVRDLIGVTDYFVIATAANSRQVDAIIDEIEDKLREEASIKPTHREKKEYFPFFSPPLPNKWAGKAAKPL